LDAALFTIFSRFPDEDDFQPAAAAAAAAAFQLLR
jgi:hypothetical protein